VDGGGASAEERRHVQRPEQRDGEGYVEPRLGRDHQRAPAEVRPWALVRNDRERGVTDDFTVAELDPEPRAPVVVVPQPRIDRRRDEQRVRAVALEERSPLHLRNHGGVQAEPGVEEEAPPLGDAEPDAPEVAAGKGYDEPL